MRALILLVSACGFHGPAAELLGKDDAAVVDSEQPPPSDTVSVDAQPQPGLDAPPSPDAPVSADAKSTFACNSSTDVTQMLCLAFESNVTDGSSSNATINVTGNGVNYANGEDGLAIALDLGDSLSIGSSSANLVTTQTNGLAIKAYVNPFALPAVGARMGIVDNDAYRMFLMPGGAVRCAIANGAGGNADLTTTGTGISAGAWTRVTCTYNGTKMLIFFDGVQKATQSKTGTIPPVTTSTQIAGNQGGGGDNFVGYLDDLQLFRTSVVAP